MTSRYHGIKISASQQSFLTEGAICRVTSSAIHQVGDRRGGLPLYLMLAFPNPDLRPFLINLPGLSPSDSFDEAVADMIHDGVNDLRSLLLKAHFEKDEAAKVRFHSLTCS